MLRTLAMNGAMVFAFGLAASGSIRACALGTGEDEASGTGQASNAITSEPGGTTLPAAQTHARGPAGLPPALRGVIEGPAVVPDHGTVPPDLRHGALQAPPILSGCEPECPPDLQENGMPAPAEPGVDQGNEPGRVIEPVRRMPPVLSACDPECPPDLSNPAARPAGR